MQNRDRDENAQYTLLRIDLCISCRIMISTSNFRPACAGLVAVVYWRGIRAVDALVTTESPTP